LRRGVLVAEVFKPVSTAAHGKTANDHAENHEDGNGPDTAFVLD
jgi:hypothetical protein